MNIDAVKIPVVEKKRPLATKIFTYSFYISCILLLLAFVFIDDQNNSVGRFFVIVMMLFLIWLFFIKHPYNIAGNLILNQSGILFLVNENKKFYPLENVDNITFQYMGYEGRWDIFSGSFDSGIGNKLSFNYFDDIVCFELKIEPQDLNKIKHIFNEWKINNREVAVKNFLGIRTSI